jgi:hypothetical protein
MEELSTLLKKLDDKLNFFISLYQSEKEENAQLTKKIELLESSLLQLQSILEEKRTLLDLKNEESLFAAMLIEDILYDLSILCPLSSSTPQEGISIKENALPAFSVVASSASEEEFV